MESPTSSALLRRVLVKISHTTRGILSWNCHFTNITAAYCYSVDEFDLAKIALSLVSLLWSFSAARKVFAILVNDASSGTIA